MKDVYTAWNVAKEVTAIIEDDDHPRIDDTAQQFNKLFSWIFGVVSYSHSQAGGYRTTTAQIGTGDEAIILDSESEDTLRWMD